MNKEVQLFNFGDAAIRTAVDDNNEPLFVAKDVAEALGYARPLEAITLHCEGGRSQTYPFETSGGIQELRVINESDVYDLIFSSRLESAKEFRRWITSDVLPTIRRTGKYDVAESPYLKHRDEVMKKYAEVKYLKETNEAKDKQIAALTEYSTYMRKTPKERQQLGFNTNRLRQTPVIELDLDLDTPFKTVEEVSSELGVSGYTINASLETLGLLDTLSRPTSKANCHYVIVEGMLHWNIKTIVRCVLSTGDIRFDLIDSVKSKFSL